jgi:hypothetical protein
MTCLEYLTVYDLGDDYAYVILAATQTRSQIRIIGGNKLACLVMANQYNRLRRRMRSGLQEILRSVAREYGRRFGTLLDPLPRLWHATFFDVSDVYRPADRIGR